VTRHIVLFSIAIATFIGCAASTRRDDRELTRRLMGSNDRLKLEIQLLTVEPVDEAAIRERLNRIAQNIDKFPGMTSKRDTAAASVRALAGQPWSGAAADRWQALEAACALCHDSLPPRTPAPLVDLRPWTTKTSYDACGRCHTAVYDEWRQTLHAAAWIDPIYRQSAGNPPKLECRSCHSMEPILAGEIDTDYSWRPIFRDYNREDGVGCVACHLRADGSVAARRDVDAPCRPRRDDRLTTTEFCGACHNPSHDAYNEWKQTVFARNGIGCSSCHSWPTTRTLPDGSARVGYSHSFPGGNDPGFVKRALHAEMRLDKRELVASLENRCGHKFPGEVPSRALGLRIETWDADNNPLDPIELWFKRPFKNLVGAPDNRLKPDERRELRQALPEKAAFVRVTCFFKPSPLVPERGWTVLHTWESEVAK